MNDIEYEYEFSADNVHDTLAYTLYLWDRYKEQHSWETSGQPEIQGEQGVQQGASQLPARGKPRQQPVQQEEARRWYSKQGHVFTTESTAECIPECVLRGTGTKAADWTQGYGTRPGQPQAERDAKGSGPLALQRLCESMQGDSIENLPSGIRPRTDDIIFNARYYTGDK